MFGLITKLTAVAGQRDRLATIMIESTTGMPGCLSYVVAIDPAEVNVLWISEVWASRERHDAAVATPAVKAALLKGRPLIAAVGPRTETVPLGGVGLPRGAGPTSP